MKALLNIHQCLFLTSLVMLMSVSTLSGQKKNPRLLPLLTNVTTLDETMHIVDSFYSSESQSSSEFESEWLKWKRWEWYMSSHLGENGEFVDIQDSMIKAYRVAQKMRPKAEQRALQSPWGSIGPTNSPLGNNDASYNGISRVDRIAFHPTDADIFYVGTPSGGLWKTTDDGSTWTNLTDHLPSIAISGIVVSHANPNHVYILTGDGDSGYDGSFQKTFKYHKSFQGVFKSSDGGVNWEQFTDFSNSLMNLNASGFRLVQDPLNADVLLAATSHGLYRTTDGGESWTRRSQGLHFDVRFKPGSSDIAYATREGEVIISENNGETWVSPDSFNVEITGSGRVQLAVTPANPNVVYALAGPATTGAFKGLWKSSNSGHTFILQSTTPNVLGKNSDGSDGKNQSRYDLALAVATNNSNKVAVGGLTVWRSTNSGVFWINATSYYEDQGPEPYIHPDVHDLQYNPVNHHLYATTDGGVYKSTDHGITWSDLTVGLGASLFYHMRVWNNASSKMMGGLQDNGVKYRQGPTQSWHHINGADGFDVTFNPLTGEPGYASINKSVRKYSNNGQDSESITPDTNYWFKTVAVHNTRPDTVLVGTNDIFRSFNGGDLWYATGASGSWALTSCPSNNSRFYAAGGVGYGDGNSGSSGVYRSDFNGVSWDTISENPGFPLTWTKITDVTVNPQNSNKVYVTIGGYYADNRVFKSVNAGDTWTNITDNLPGAAVFCIGVDASDNIYIGTDIGVFYRASTMSNWMLWSNELPNVAVTDIAVQNNYVRCSTFGRGAFSAWKAGSCDDDLNLSYDLDGDQLFETNNTISSTSEVYGGSGTYVTFRTGDRIDLETGFEVKANNQFHAYLGPCGEGNVPELWQPGSSDAQTRNNPQELEVTHAFPLGSIDNITHGPQSLTTDVTVRQKGRVQFIVQGQNISVELYSADMEYGQSSINLDISELPEGFYHILMYNDDRLAHFQELNIR